MRNYEQEEEKLHRWLEDERRALRVTYSDERPEYGLWKDTVLIACAMILILVAAYQLGAVFGLI